MIKSSIFFDKKHGLITPLQNPDFLDFFKALFFWSKKHSFLYRISKKRSFLFKLVKIGQENVFDDILERKKAFLQYENKTIKK